MKTVLLSVIVVFCALTTFAQTSDAEAEAISNLLHVQKREIIVQLVPVSGKDSIAFWKIYSEYEKEAKGTTKDRIKLYEATAMAYSKMNPAIADSLAGKYFANRMSHEQTLEVYYKKIKAATNAVIAFEFYQAEVYIVTQIRASIMQQIPTYGQLQGAMKEIDQDLQDLRILQDAFVSHRINLRS